MGDVLCQHRIPVNVGGVLQGADNPQQPGESPPAAALPAPELHAGGRGHAGRVALLRANIRLHRGCARRARGCALQPLTRQQSKRELTARCWAGVSVWHVGTGDFVTARFWQCALNVRLGWQAPVSMCWWSCDFRLQLMSQGSRAPETRVPAGAQPCWCTAARASAARRRSRSRTSCAASRGRPSARASTRARAAAWSTPTRVSGASCARLRPSWASRSGALPCCAWNPMLC